MPRPRRSSPLSLLLLAATPAFAQPEIVVTGRALPDAPGDAALSIVEVGRDRLTGTASGRLEEAMKDVAGLQQFRRADARSANPTSQGATLRGLGGNAAARVLVLLDGVPQGDPFAGYINWPSYLPERLRRARVTRGGGSGAAGPGALAGTIELDSVDTGGMSASLAGGSFGSGEARGQLAGRLGQGFALLSGGYARGDGFMPIVSPGPVDRGARHDQWNVAARGVVPLDGGELQANVAAFDDIRTRGTDFSRNATSGADASLRYVGRRAMLLGYLQVRKFASQFSSVDAARATVTPTLDQFDTPATGFGLKGEWRPTLGTVDLRIGSEWRRTVGETNEFFAYQAGNPTRVRRAGGASDIFGGFVEATHVAGPLTVTGGARIDRWSLTRGNLSERALAGGPEALTAFPRRGGWEPTGRLGAALEVFPTLTLRSAAYFGWRLPTLNELYRPFRVGIELTQANAALRPERSRGVEAGAQWQPVEGAEVGVTAFAMTLDDAVANVTVSTAPTLVTRQRQNLARIASRGFEVDAAFRRGDWRLAASASYADSRIRGVGPLGGLRPASVAPFQASGTVGWRGLSATLRYVSPQFDDDQNTRSLSPALTLDAVADVPLSAGLWLRGRIENAFDTRIEAARNAGGVVERASPRAVWIGLRIEK